MLEKLKAKCDKLGEELQTLRGQSIDPYHFDSICEFRRQDARLSDALFRYQFLYETMLTFRLAFNLFHHLKNGLLANDHTNVLLGRIAPFEDYLVFLDEYTQQIVLLEEDIPRQMRIEFNLYQDEVDKLYDDSLGAWIASLKGTFTRLQHFH